MNWTQLSLFDIIEVTTKDKETTMHKESLLEVIGFIEGIIDDLENDLVPIDEVADTEQDILEMTELQIKIDTLSQLILDLMSFDWDKK